MKNPIYAGVGSRRTPKHILEEMTKFARKMDKLGWVLSTGDAEGADTAFASGATNPIIYSVNIKDQVPPYVYSEAQHVASRFHPTWNYCSPYAKKLLTRNVFIILGPWLETPVDFLIYWRLLDIDRGGTLHDVRIAQGFGIPTLFIGAE